jgi:hypothetical protein
LIITSTSFRLGAVHFFQRRIVMAQKTMISLQISEDLLARMTELPSVVDPVTSEMLAEMSRSQLVRTLVEIGLETVTKAPAVMQLMAGADR